MLRKFIDYRRDQIPHSQETWSPFKGSWGHIKVELVLRKPFSFYLRTYVEKVGET